MAKEHFASIEDRPTLLRELPYEQVERRVRVEGCVRRDPARRQPERLGAGRTGIEPAHIGHRRDLAGRQGRGSRRSALRSCGSFAGAPSSSTHPLPVPAWRWALLLTAHGRLTKTLLVRRIHAGVMRVQDTTPNAGGVVLLGQRLAGCRDEEEAHAQRRHAGTDAVTRFATSHFAEPS